MTVESRIRTKSELAEITAAVRGMLVEATNFDDLSSVEQAVCTEGVTQMSEVMAGLQPYATDERIAEITTAAILHFLVSVRDAKGGNHTQSQIV